MLILQGSQRLLRALLIHDNRMFAERAFYCLNRLGMVCSSIIIIHVNIQKIVIQVMTNMHKIYRQISSQTLTKKYDIDII